MSLSLLKTLAKLRGTCPARSVGFALIHRRSQEGSYDGVFLVVFVCVCFEQCRRVLRFASFYFVHVLCFVRLSFWFTNKEVRVAFGV